MQVIFAWDTSPNFEGVRVKVALPPPQQFWRTQDPLFYPKTGLFEVSRTHDPLFALFTRISGRLQANSGTTVHQPRAKAGLFTDNGTTVRENLLCRSKPANYEIINSIYNNIGGWKHE